MGWVGMVGGWEFGLGGEIGVWRSVRMRSGVGGEDLVLSGDWVGIRAVALCWYIHSSPYNYPNTRHTPPHPAHSHFQSQTPTQPIYPTTVAPICLLPPQKLSSVLRSRTCHHGGFAVH